MVSQNIPSAVLRHNVLATKQYVVSTGQQVVSDYTHKIVVKEDGTQSLIIVPAIPEDSGEWTVIAQNRAGRSSVSVSLAVEGLTAPRQGYK